jgi:MazG family protein
MKEFDKLIKILKELRNPIYGCPWDLKQTESNLKEYILEESYELVEAIESGLIEKEIEELGDLLLQIFFICQINKERNNFTIKDVLNRINTKLIKRHPHVFGETKVKSPDEVKSLWEKNKRIEKDRRSVISDYPLQMPSLSVSKRISVFLFQKEFQSRLQVLVLIGMMQ